MRIGFVGLGKMGAQIVEKLLHDDHEVVVFDVNTQAIDACAELGADAAYSKEEFIKKLGDEPIVWLMIPADFVQSEVDYYTNNLPSGSVLIDGGNSQFWQTIERSKLCSEQGIQYIDVGTSGGIRGLKNGFSMMVGGDKHTYLKLSPVLKSLAHPHGAHAYMGESGSGHYVKMIHNGIEYAMMQAYAEGYDLLKYGQFKNLDLESIAAVWQKGSIVSSNLNEIIHEIFEENSELEGIDGYVADSGEGRWTYETAQKANVPMPALREALQVRQASQNGYHTFATKLLAAMRNKFGGHAINK